MGNDSASGVCTRGMARHVAPGPHDAREGLRDSDEGNNVNLRFWTTFSNPDNEKKNLLQKKLHIGPNKEI